MKLNPFYINNLVKTALSEDIGTGDITSNLIDKDCFSFAFIMNREPMIVSGIPILQSIFQQIDKKIQCKYFVTDSDRIKKNKKLLLLYGPTRSLLIAERTALNFLQFLSGIATTTAEYIKKISHTSCQLLDTRKTIPGLRLAQKYAVYCGGGKNHRIGLFDSFLIKENHIHASNSIISIINNARVYNPKCNLIVEVESIEQLIQVKKLNVNRIILDNFSIQDIKESVSIINNKIPLEVSGNISLNNIQNIAETGVNFISSGSITKNIKSIDLTMKLVEIKNI